MVLSWSASTSLADPSAQVRNVWDSDLNFSGNHVNVYLDIDSEGAYLTSDRVNTNKSLATQGSTGTTQYTVKFTGFSETDFDYRSNSDSNDDLVFSENYEIEGSTGGTAKLVGLTSGQMEMGFLFYVRVSIFNLIFSLKTFWLFLLL